MTTEMKQRLIELAASYFANWKYEVANMNYDVAARYREKYDGAQSMASLLDITEQEIEDAAWSKYGNEIGKAYESNYATW